MRVLPLLLAALLLTGPFLSAGQADADTLMVEADDAAMNAAIAEAKAKLPLFVAQAATADLSQGDFLVKWAHPILDDTSVEHIWVTVTALTDTAAIGVLANQPVDFAGTQGDPAQVLLTDISDWSWWDAEGKLHGSYTTRVMVPQLSAEDQAYFASILAPLPE
ncbi:MAG: DUF2314 domain-containing protein [Paracoccaceae bacterium]